MHLMDTSGGPHDVGGALTSLPIDLTERPFQHWERAVHALMVCLVQKKLLTVDEMRRAIEGLPKHVYEAWGYYEKWAAGIAAVSIERGTISQLGFDQALGLTTSEPTSPRFNVGDSVSVHTHERRAGWRKPHLRCPGYIFGATGVVERVCGLFDDPELKAYRGGTQQQYLYRVRFERCELWRDMSVKSSDTIDVEASCIDTLSCRN